MRTDISASRFTVRVLIVALVLSVFVLMAGAGSAYAVTQSQVDAAKAELDAAKAEASEAAEAYYAAEDNHDAAVKKMKETKEKIASSEKEIAEKQARLSNRAVTMYRDGSISMIDVFFGASSFKEFVTLWDLMTELNDNDAKLIGDIKQLKIELEQAYVDYSEAEKEAKKQMEAAKELKEEVEAKAAEFESAYNSLSAEMQAQINAAYEAENAGNGGNGGNGGGGGGSTSSGSYKSGGGSGPCDVGLARSLLGCSYNYGSTGPTSFDCSGLCYYCGAPYRSSQALYNNASSRVSTSEAQPGDVVWMPGHVGIYAGNGQVIEAEDYGTGVVVRSVSKYSCALRF